MVVLGDCGGLLVLWLVTTVTFLTVWTKILARPFPKGTVPFGAPNIMAYHSTPYAGMTPKKMAATLKVYKWRARNVCVRLVNSLYTSLIRHYRVLPWATGPLTLLESIAKVPDRQVAQTGKSSIFWLSFFILLSFLHHDSMITAEAIAMIQTQTCNINHWVLHSLLIVIVQLKLFFSDFQALWS